MGIRKLPPIKATLFRTNGLTAPHFPCRKAVIGSPLFPMEVPLIEVTIRFPLKSSSPGPWVFWIQCRPRQKWSSHWDLLGRMRLVEVVLAKCGEVKPIQSNKALIVFDYDVQYEYIEVEVNGDIKKVVKSNTDPYKILMYLNDPSNRKVDLPTRRGQ